MSYFNHPRVRRFHLSYINHRRNDLAPKVLEEKCLGLAWSGIRGQLAKGQQQLMEDKQQVQPVHPLIPRYSQMATPEDLLYPLRC